MAMRGAHYLAIGPLVQGLGKGSVNRRVRSRGNNTMWGCTESNVASSNGMHTCRFGYNGAHRRGAGRGGNGPSVLPRPF